MSFESSAAFVLAHEGDPDTGSYHIDPNDPGGATKWGLSHRSYPYLDLENTTKADALAIYKRDYWDALKCGRMGPRTALAVFDAGFNQGVPWASQELQRELGIAADGKLGDVTLGALAKRDDFSLAKRFLMRRILRYASLDEWRVYGAEWTERVLDLAVLLPTFT